MNRPGAARSAWFGRYGVITSFVLHCVTGLAAVAAHYGIMWAVLRAGTPSLAATCLGFAGGAATRFFLSYHTVFAPTRRARSAALRFVGALGLQFLANAGLFWALTQLGLPVWPAQVITTIALTVINYLIYRLWVFT